MENIIKYESFINEGISSNNGLKTLIDECNKIASDLMRVNGRGKALGKLTSAIANSIEKDPNELRNIYDKIMGFRSEIFGYNRFSRIPENPKVVPVPGYDPEGILAYVNYFDYLMRNSLEISKSIEGIDTNWVYHFGKVLYYIFVLSESDVFPELLSLFNI